MKRLVLLLSLVLLLALAACDTMGPQQDAISTVPAAATTGVEGATALPQEVATAAPSTGEGEAEGQTASGADLLGVTWEWVSLVDPAGQTTATDPTRYTITFNSDGTANLKADCNTATATYITDGVNLNIEPGVTSLAACPSDTQDQLFLNSLSAAESYAVQDGELFITMVGESGTMIFRPAGSGAAEGESTGGEAPEAQPTLTGVTWEWTQTTTMVGTTEVVDPTRYSITFNEDGTANIKADCNNVLGNYTADSTGAFSLTLGPSTLMACPEDSQVNDFLAGLAVLGAYTFDGEDLILSNTAADGGAMRFRAAGAAETPSGTSPVVPTALTGVTWEWLGTTTGAGEEITTADPSRYQITFNDDGTAGLVADCNVGSATYTAGDDGALSITLGVSTLAFCENSQDTQFREGLAAAAAYAIQDGALTITQIDGGAMRFRAAQVGGPTTEEPATDTLTGVTWQWMGTTTPVEQITVADPTRYTVLFNEDGTANITADCNVGTATYTTGEGGAITITPGAMTLAMCPEDSQGTPFMAGLSSAAIYFFQDGDLYIDQFASSGTMHFTPATTTEAEGETPGKGETGALPSGDALIGQTWQLTQITKSDGTLTINDPTRYTLTFNADGTANVLADCNVNIMTYTLGEGNALTITPGISTMAFCGPGSLDQVYLGGLANAMAYRMEGGNLIIDMLYESGSLIFVLAG